MHLYNPPELTREQQIIWLFQGLLNPLTPKERKAYIEDLRFYGVINDYVSNALLKSFKLGGVRW